MFVRIALEVARQAVCSAQKTFIVETRDDLDAERPPKSPLLRRAVALFSGLMQATLETRIPQWLLGKCQPVPEGGGSISVSVDNLRARKARYWRAFLSQNKGILRNPH